MSKIDDLIAQHCPKGVASRPIKELCVRHSGLPLTAGQMRELASSKGDVRIFAGGQTIADVLAEDIENDFIEGPGLIVKSRGIIDFEYWSGRFSHKNELWSYKPNSEELNLKFLYYFLKTRVVEVQQIAKANSVKMPQIKVGDIDSMRVPVPPLEIQNEIVKILDKFTVLEAELEAELEARNKQYEFYRKSTLVFDVDKVPYCNLSELYEFKYGMGNKIPTSGGNFPVYGSNGIVGSHDEFNSEDAPVIGHIGAYAGIVNWAKGKHFVTYNGVICKIKNGHNPRFGYHLLKNLNLRELANAGSQPFVSYDKLNSVQIQIPDFETQERLSTLMDNFELLTNDIAGLLPKEIHARRKQYEFYRNRLLTFKELG